MEKTLWSQSPGIVGMFKLVFLSALLILLFSMPALLYEYWDWWMSTVQVPHWAQHYLALFVGAEMTVTLGLIMASGVFLFSLVRVAHWKFQRYTITDDRIRIRKGILITTYHQIELFRVVDLHVRVSLLDRLFGRGTLSIVTGDRALPALSLHAIKQPHQAKNVLREAISNIRGGGHPRMVETL